MGIKPSDVYVANADQSSTTGALRRGAVITTIPADLTAAMTAISSFTSSGYISEDGATLTTDVSTTDLKEWNKNAVRRLLDSFDGNVALILIQLDEEGAKQTFGSSNVTVVAANSTHGKQLKIGLGAHLPEPQAWALCMKDGNKKMLVLIPNGQVTSGVEITFSASDAVKLPITISANDDGTGNSIYIYTDDGVTTA